jgi:hypothetical protein
MLYLSTKSDGSRTAREELEGALQVLASVPGASPDATDPSPGSGEVAREGLSITLLTTIMLVHVSRFPSFN